MAKRKRLTPARPDFLSTEAQIEPNPPETDTQAPETKTMFPMGVAKTTPRPPIAQVAGEAAISAALTEMTDMVARARSEGRIVEVLPLSSVEMGHLVRDRVHVHSDDLDALKSSLKARGQQTPIEVVDRGEGAFPRYGLISGWRRMVALSDIGAVEVLAIVRHPQTSSDAYVAMVEENEIRADISFYERARIVVKALEQGVYSDPKQALQTLFANVSRAKRSKIKSFMTLVEALDGHLRFPSAISERVGLELVKRLQADPGLIDAMTARLSQEVPSTAEAEVAVLLGEGLTQKTRTPTQPRETGPVNVAYHAQDRRIELTGAGVDVAFARALETWLKTRSPHDEP
ncbi:ParB/RepB/Spo0J family partition protein [Celeribacter baekdonensis]|uniref:ParB/RepB/Spo0J family partition protein n=1 Tax=Celeribacter baekdonensis TaxID=875171 RepID=UPI003A8DBBE4